MFNQTKYDLPSVAKAEHWGAVDLAERSATDPIRWVIQINEGELK